MICARNLAVLRNSAPLADPEIDDAGDTLFVPERGTHEAPLAQSVRPALSTWSTDDEDTASIPTWTATDQRLYRQFCEDVRAAEAQEGNPRTRQGMASLWRREPDLQPTFRKCLGIADRTMGGRVVDEWRKFVAQGRERRAQHEGSDHSAETAVGGEGSLGVVQKAYGCYMEARKAKTATWKACFCYRRAAIGLVDQSDAYAKLPVKEPVDRLGASLTDTMVVHRSMFRDMNAQWRNALSSDFTEKQANEKGYGREWSDFKETLRDGRRWRIFSKHLGLCALLLVDTTDRTTYLQRELPIPVFTAWTQLIPRVVPEIKEVVGRMEGYYDRVEHADFFLGKLRPLKLERNYDVGNPSEFFEFSGSEGRRTPTADPSLLTKPSDAMGLQYRSDLDYMRREQDEELYSMLNLS